MPLIILGLIVVLGGALLIYYQLGPKVTLRLKGSSLFGGGPASDGPEQGAEAVEEAESGAAARGEDVKPTVVTEDGVPKTSDRKPEKVIYIYGDGEVEERSLRDNDGKPEEK